MKTRQLQILYTNVHSSMTDNRPKVETTPFHRLVQVLIKRGISAQWNIIQLQKERYKPQHVRNWTREAKWWQTDRELTDSVIPFAQCIWDGQTHRDRKQTSRWRGQGGRSSLTEGRLVSPGFSLGRRNALKVIRWWLHSSEDTENHWTVHCKGLYFMVCEHLNKAPLKKALEPRLVWLRGLSTGQRT